MEFEREEEDAAAAEAGRIGGDPYQHAPARTTRSSTSRRTGARRAETRESWRPVEEAGGGEAEGFEEAEAELVERAENRHGPSPLADAEEVDEEEAALDPEFGEADEVHTSEDDPDERRGLLDSPPSLGSRPTAGPGFLVPVMAVRIRPPQLGPPSAARAVSSSARP